jgi:hypothetical protein
LAEQTVRTYEVVYRLQTDSAYRDFIHLITPTIFLIIQESERYQTDFKNSLK